MLGKLATLSLVPMGILIADVAHACVMVAHGPPPKLEGERVLIMFDEEKSIEHFVREIRVDKVTEDFGFVVPVPSEPEVAKAPNVFDRLEKTFAVVPPMYREGMGAGGEKGVPRAIAVAPPAVQVVAEAKVGSFVATTIKANDATALEKWLAERKFTLGPGGAPWLKHYVLRNAYFVAFKFDAKSAGNGAMKSEAVRLSFKTAHPFYPYLEPDGPAVEKRSLGLWFTSTSKYVPRANLVREDGTMKLVDPWQETSRKTDVTDRVKSSVGTLANLLPSGALQVQTFLDQRPKRSGLGDVIMISESPREIPTDLAMRSALFLDQAAIPGEPAVTVAP